MHCRSIFLFCVSCFAYISLVTSDRQAQQVIATPPAASLPATSSFLNFTSSSPHIFSSLRSLLQQWPNTYFPNGHSIVPCEIPPYTNLYHGRSDREIPPSPEWFAFDIEMSYGIMGSFRTSHMLTYQTVKPVKCLYFDGMSAALMGEGQLDSQMVFLYGNTSGPGNDRPFRGLGDEYARATGLCRWIEENGVGGVGWGVEGVVRMNAGFELIWCNFTSPSIRLVSHLNVTTPLLPVDESEDQNLAPEMLSEHLVQRVLHPSKSLFPLPSSTKRYDEATAPANPPLPPNWRNNRGREAFLESQTFEWFRSATWHYGSSGGGPGERETRVKLLTCGFLGFYDETFASLALARAVEERDRLNLTLDGTWQGPGPSGNRTRALEELTRRRRHHTLASLEASEAALMNNAAYQVLRSQGISKEITGDTKCTGIDWSDLTSQLATRYSKPLTQLSRLISGTNPSSLNETSMRTFLARARNSCHGLLMPFLEYPSLAFNESTLDAPTWTLNSDLGQSTFSRCKYAYTRLLYDNDNYLLESIGQEEAHIIAAVEDILSAICSSIIDVGFGVEYTWLSTFNLPPTARASNAMSKLDELPKEVARWSAALEELVAWLGWASDDYRCEEVCSKDETCYIPMWPLIFSEGSGGKRRWGGGGGGPPPRRPPNNGTNPGDGRDGGGPREPDDGRQPPPDGAPPRRPPRWAGLEEGLWKPRCIKPEIHPRFA